MPFTAKPSIKIIFVDHLLRLWFNHFCLLKITVWSEMYGLNIKPRRNLIFWTTELTQECSNLKTKPIQIQYSLVNIKILKINSSGTMLTIEKKNKTYVGGIKKLCIQALSDSLYKIFYIREFLFDCWNKAHWDSKKNIWHISFYGVDNTITFNWTSQSSVWNNTGKWTIGAKLFQNLF